jgi:LysR family glycine cleavage system transcriptional activator
MVVSATPNISLRGLRMFCVAARHESFRLASQELFITPSAVSHQIKTLEQVLGQKLFDRKNRELSLTETGRSLYEDISPLIDQLQTIAAGYKQGGLNSALRISVQPFFASEFFIPRLSEFTEQHPNIDIQVGTSDETAEKHPPDADLSIRLFRSPPTNMPSRKLFPLRLAPAGSPDFKKKMQVKRKAVVSDFPVIVHEARPKAWAQWADMAGVQLPQGGKVIRLDSMIAAIRAAERGIGAALVPVPLADLWFKHGSIVRLFDQVLLTDASYYLVWKEDKAADKSVCKLREWILQNFSEFD